MSRSDFGGHVVVPVATEADARKTAAALAPRRFDRVTVVQVVEKGEGVPDETSVERSERRAARAFATFRETFPDAETEITYRRDVVEPIVDVAHDVDARAIVFRPRGGGRVPRGLAGDRPPRLFTEANRPVITIRGGECG